MRAIQHSKTVNTNVIRFFQSQQFPTWYKKTLWNNSEKKGEKSNAIYLRGTNFVESHKDECIEKESHWWIFVKLQGADDNQNELRQECCQANDSSIGGASCQVQHVEVDGEIVSNVSPDDVVEIGFLQEVPAISE